MSTGGLTGAGGGSIAGATPPPSTKQPDSASLISYAQASLPKSEGAKREGGGKADTDTKAGGDGLAQSEEQSQKLQDFDAVKGRRPLADSDPNTGQGKVLLAQSGNSKQDPEAVSSKGAPDVELGGKQSTEPRQEICAKVSGTGEAPCVQVRGGEALSDKDKEALASAYRDFIVKNDGADLSEHSADVIGYTKEDAAKVRVASQFIGANLPDGWRNTRIIAGSGDDLRMSSDTAGNTEWQKIATDDPPELYIVKINMDWGDHRTNPSGLARTMIHESLHRHDEGGWVTVVNEKHRALDTEARNRLQDYGLGAGGCLPVGEFLWGLLPPTYPGCSK